MKELYVHSAVKMLFAVPQVLNVILKPNIKNHSKMILRRMKLLKRQFLLTKNKLAFLKKPFAVQIIAECIAKRKKPFTNGDYIKEVFVNCSEVLFEDLPNKKVILSRIKNLPVSARTVERRVEDMAANVKIQQAVALQSVKTFSVALDKVWISMIFLV